MNREYQLAVLRYVFEYPTEVKSSNEHIVLQNMYIELFPFYRELKSLIVQLNKHEITKNDKTYIIGRFIGFDNYEADSLHELSKGNVFIIFGLEVYKPHVKEFSVMCNIENGRIRYMNGEAADREELTIIYGGKLVQEIEYNQQKGYSYKTTDL